MIAALRKRLLDDTAIAAVVGSNGVYVWPAPKGATYPMIIIQSIALEEDRNLSGTQPGYEMENWQIDVYAKTVLAARSLEKLVRNRLRTTGPQLWTDAQNAGYAFLVHYVELQGVADGFEPIDNAQAEAGTARRILTYLIKNDRDSTI